MVSARPVVFGVEPLGNHSASPEGEIITVSSGRTDTFASHTVTRSLSIAGLRAIGTAVCNSIAQNIRTPVMEAPFGLGISRSGHDKSRRGRETNVFGLGTLAVRYLVFGICDTESRPPPPKRPPIPHPHSAPPYSPAIPPPGNPTLSHQIFY